MILDLPYPPSKLNPNRQSRVHWAPNARATKAYRNEWAGKARDQGLTEIRADRVRAKITIHPPNRRKRDVQNAIAAMKPGIDGLADVSGVDDSRWEIAWPVAFAEPVEGGCVTVEIEL